MSTNKEKICIACEREKAKLPTFRILAKQRAVKEKKIIVIVFDEEDKKYIAMDEVTSQKRGYKAIEYYLP